LFIGLLKTMRPRQWPKNGFVFAALLFDSQLRLTELDTVGRVMVAFLLFCVMSSAVYLMNDLIDIESDRAHPRKRNRPLPSGELSPAVARAAFLLLAIGGLAASAALDLRWNTRLSLVLLAYLLLQVAYTLKLKHVVLLDVFAVAGGFVLRVAGGVAVITVTRFSPWLYVCAGLLALFMALGKRRHELLLLGANAASHRAILDEYNLDLVDRLLGTVTTSAVVAYSLYTFLAEGLPDNHVMMLTIPFVLYGLFRYLYLIHVRGEGGAPEEILLRDRPLQVTLFFWIATVYAGLYLLA
jgi:4-hydroxybenzoate polyprenyltransferase